MVGVDFSDINSTSTYFWYWENDDACIWADNKVLMPVYDTTPEIVFREAEFRRDYPGPVAQAAIDGKLRWVDLESGQFVPSSNVEVIGQHPNGLKIGKSKVPAR